MAGQILVIGSSNTDMVVKTDRLPAPGETVLGGTFLMNPGGKGANQAVAAARLSRTSPVTFVAKVGDDIFGQQAVSGFQREGIDTAYIRTDSEFPSGVALINVDARGENCITVASGANGNLQSFETKAALMAAPAGTVVLLQLEIPLPTVEYVVQQAAERGLPVILNPAPARSLPAAIFPKLFLLTPNETEAELLTGIRVTDPSTAALAARKLHNAGVPNVVITLGAKGAYLSTASDDQSGVTALVPAPAVTPVDSTAAGDCFNGALAVAMSEGQSLAEAVAFACKAASLSVTRLGAQASVPRRTEVDEVLPII